MRDKCSVWGSAQHSGLPCRLKRMEIVCFESLVGMGREQLLGKHQWREDCASSSQMLTAGDEVLQSLGASVFPSGELL